MSEKAEKSQQISVRLSPELRRKLDFVAEEDFRTLSEQLAKFASDGVSRWEQQKRERDHLWNWPWAGDDPGS
jgi:predicted transcriptional regulator